MPLTVLTARDLRLFVLWLADEHETKIEKTLEEYLRSVWASIIRHSQAHPSYPLFATIFEEGFSVPPTPFDSSWYQYAELPINPSFDRTELPPDASEAPNEAEVSDFECLRRTILFLIADLNRFSPEQMRGRRKHFGLESPTGHIWHNWDPFGYLECATRGFMAILKNSILKGSSETNCNWATLALILDIGRTYE